MTEAPEFGGTEKKTDRQKDNLLLLHTIVQARRKRGGWGGFSPSSFWQINSPYLDQGGHIIPTHYY